MVWADPEKAVLDRVADLVGGPEHTSTRLPINLREHLPMIYAHWLGGTDYLWEVTGRMAITVYGANRDAAWSVANAVSVRLLSTGGFVQDGVELDVARRGSIAPMELTYADANIRMIVASYPMTVRRSPAELTT